MLVYPHTLLYILKQIAKHHTVPKNGITFVQVPQGHLVTLGNIG